MFQFTHPGGVRQFPSTSNLPTSKFQFTHPGGVRPHVQLHIGALVYVSIHAPGRGATGSGDKILLEE